VCWDFIPDIIYNAISGISVFEIVLDLTLDIVIMLLPGGALLAIGSLAKKLYTLAKWGRKIKTSCKSMIQADKFLKSSGIIKKIEAASNANPKTNKAFIKCVEQSAKEIGISNRMAKKLLKEANNSREQIIKEALNNLSDFLLNFPEEYNMIKKIKGV
jgi:hypothetical protein